MVGRSFMIWQIRSNDALPRCIRFTTQPMAIIGQTSMPMYVLNITKLPSEIFPLRTRYRRPTAQSET